jgi:predicted enzyme related to lactoylglutathione lyase
VENALTWFEIPAVDFARAEKFYNTIFDTELVPMKGIKHLGLQMSLFPHGENAVGGGVIKGAGYVPSAEGTVVYLNGGDDLNVVLNRVEAAGGQVLLPKTSIGKNGYMAFFLDTEGNKVGLNSMG